MQTVIVITSNKHLMPMRQCRKPLHKILHLLDSSLLAEVTRVNDYIRQWKMLHLAM